MKFGIKRRIYETKTNINGKFISCVCSYYVYRKVFFGLFKVYLQILPYEWKHTKEVVVKYTSKEYARVFSTEKEAKQLIEEMQKNPDKFVRYI